MSYTPIDNRSMQWYSDARKEDRRCAMTSSPTPMTRGYIMTLCGGLCWAIGGACGQVMFRGCGVTSDWLVPIRLFTGGIITLLIAALTGGMPLEPVCCRDAWHTGLFPDPYHNSHNGYWKSQRCIVKHPRRCRKPARVFSSTDQSQCLYGVFCHLPPFIRCISSVR